MSDVKWKLVPVEPTDEMDLAGAREVDRTNPYDCDVVANIYHAMLAAAPSPAEALPSQRGAEVGVREAAISVMASLAAAISLLERTPKAKKAAPSDRMFDQMLDDYRAALEAGRAALAKPASEAGGGGAREALGPSEDWSEKLAELYVWTGSAFLAGEKVEDEAGHKSRLYGFLCGLIGYLMLGRDAALSSPASSSPAEEAQGAASALRPFAREAEFWDHAPDDYNFGACGLSITVGDFRRARDAASRPSSSLAEEAQS